MKYLSLFTGIGGFELGIGPEHECIGYSEVDRYAITIYESHFNHINYGDIKTIDADKLPDFDFLCGGFPCQSFSIAGKRMGFSDTRGTLFFDIARILRAKRPRLFLLENVKGLLSHENGKTFGVIIATLTELGYDLEWQVLNSKNHGVPQNRERIFILGHLRGTPRPEVFPYIENNGEATYGTVKNTYHKGQTTGSYIDETTKDTIKVAGYLYGGTWASDKRHESARRVYDTDGIAPTLPTASGGGIMPKIIQKSPDWRKDGSLRKFEKISPTLRANMGDNHPMVQIPEATKKGYAEARPGQSINLSVLGSKTRRGRVSDIANTLDTGMQQHTLTENMQIRRLTPTECERLQGFPDGWTGCVSDTQRYKTLGNAVTVNVIRDICKKLLK